MIKYKYTYEVYGKDIHDTEFKFYEYPDSFIKFILSIIRHRKYDEIHAHRRVGRIG